LEAVAILPQLFMLQRRGEAETITAHYLFALGSYRGLYILNWVYRYFTDGYFDPIVLVAGLIQTVLYAGKLFINEIMGFITKSFTVYSSHYFTS
jgi:ER lumen protein retaining receptor